MGELDALGILASRKLRCRRCTIADRRDLRYRCRWKARQLPVRLPRRRCENRYATRQEHAGERLRRIDPHPAGSTDRKSAVEGKRVAVGGEPGGGRSQKQKKK